MEHRINVNEQQMIIIIIFKRMFRDGDNRNERKQYKKKITDEMTVDWIDSE